MEVRDFIVCDDIRQEIGRKHTIVGVYDESIEFFVPRAEAGKWPKALKLGFFIRVRFEEKDQLPDKFSLHVVFENSDEQLIGEGKLDIGSKTRKRNLNIVLVHNRFPLPKQSTMKFNLRFYNQEKQIFKISPSSGIRIAEHIIETSGNNTASVN